MSFRRVKGVGLAAIHLVLGPRHTLTAALPHLRSLRPPCTSAVTVVTWAQWRTGSSVGAYHTSVQMGILRTD